jgi:hypothetical protein
MGGGKAKPLSVREDSDLLQADLFVVHVLSMGLKYSGS